MLCFVIVEMEFLALTDEQQQQFCRLTFIVTSQLTVSNFMNCMMFVRSRK